MSRRVMFIAGAVVILVAGFLLFRPDKLFVDDVVGERLDDAFLVAAETVPPSTTSTTRTPSTTSPSTSVGTTPGTTAPAPSTTAQTPSAAAPARPVGVSTGAFFGIDHSAEGTATVYEQDGRYVLRLEDDTDIQNGPDLYVWLTTGTDWYDPGEHLDLGKLKGNVGGQNYELPPEYDPDIHRHVLIWCLRFTVPFAAAEMG